MVFLLRTRKSIGALGIILVAALDRIIKQLALSTFPESVSFTREYAGVLSLSEAAGFSLIALALAAVCIHAYVERAQPLQYHVAILLGAVSNIADRLIYGGVVDWIPTPLMTLNGSDVLIMIGVCALVARECASQNV